MARPAIYLDECVPVSLSMRLNELGYECSTARDHGMLGEEDDVHLAFAATHRLIVLTHNVRDFARLHHEYVDSNQQHSGIVLLPQTRQLALTAARCELLLAWISVQNDHTNRLYRWNDFQQRLILGERYGDQDESFVRFALGG